MSTTLIPYADYDEEVVPEELAELGSFNHSYLQVRLAVLLSGLDEYTVFTELSLDASGLTDLDLKNRFKDVLKPDVSLYPKRGYLPLEDILKMSEMPLLAIEILSPMQASQHLISKMRAYFDLGVQSVWIVYPTPRTITVYASPNQAQSFAKGNVEDKTLDIALLLNDIFR